MFLIGQIIIGLFFIATGIFNIFKWKQQVEKVKAKNIAYPQTAFIIALILQIVGGIFLTTNYHATLGAIATFIFTFLATFFFMRFWQETEPQAKEIRFLFFVEHCAVMGALLMVIGH